MQGQLFSHVVEGHSQVCQFCDLGDTHPRLVSCCQVHCTPSDYRHRIDDRFRHEPRCQKRNRRHYQDGKRGIEQIFSHRRHNFRKGSTGAGDPAQISDEDPCGESIDILSGKLIDPRDLLAAFYRLNGHCIPVLESQGRAGHLGTPDQ
ncbi:MAG: hypothetical protein EHM23_15690 [Acidobacteria bacterium]|nr:MAG: hypothetical protein EHM23_15690 [Acidobacteriota bacterium]